MASLDSAQQALAQFIQHEREVRSAATVEALAYCLVNRSQGLLGYRHAALLVHGGARASRYRRGDSRAPCTLRGLR